MIDIMIDIDILHCTISTDSIKFKTNHFT